MGFGFAALWRCGEEEPRDSLISRVGTKQLAFPSGGFSCARVRRPWLVCELDGLWGTWAAGAGRSCGGGYLPFMGGVFQPTLCPCEASVCLLSEEWGQVDWDATIGPCHPRKVLPSVLVL